MKTFFALLACIIPFAVPAVCFADAPLPPRYTIGNTGIRTSVFFLCLAAVTVALVIIIKVIKNKRGK